MVTGAGAFGLQYSPFLGLSLRRLLLSITHDALIGCSLDPTHSAPQAREEALRRIAASVI